MSVTITRQPNNVHRQRYAWHHEVIGRFNAGSGFTHTFIGAWIQSVHERVGRRLYLWRLAAFTAKTWRMP